MMNFLTIQDVRAWLRAGLAAGKITRTVIHGGHLTAGHGRPARMNKSHAGTSQKDFYWIEVVDPPGLTPVNEEFKAFLFVACSSATTITQMKLMSRMAKFMGQHLPGHHVSQGPDHIKGK